MSAVMLIFWLSQSGQTITQVPFESMKLCNGMADIMASENYITSLKGDRRFLCLPVLLDEKPIKGLTARAGK